MCRRRYEAVLDNKTLRIECKLCAKYFTPRKYRLHVRAEHDIPKAVCPWCHVQDKPDYKHLTECSKRQISHVDSTKVVTTPIPDDKMKMINSSMWTYKCPECTTGFCPPLRFMTHEHAPKSGCTWCGGPKHETLPDEVKCVQAKCTKNPRADAGRVKYFRFIKGVEMECPECNLVFSGTSYRSHVASYGIPMNGLCIWCRKVDRCYKHRYECCKKAAVALGSAPNQGPCVFIATCPIWRSKDTYAISFAPKSDRKLLQMNACSPEKVTIVRRFDAKLAFLRGIEAKFVESRVRGDFYKFTDDDFVTIEEMYNKYISH